MFAEELFELCRDYCDVSWGRALDVEGVPTYLVWRQPGSIYYHPDICEVPGAIPSHSAFALETSQLHLTAQAALPLLEASKGSSQAGDQGQGAKGAKDKDKGKEKKNFLEAADATKAKEEEVKTKEADPKAKDATISQPSQKPSCPQGQGLALRIFFQFFFFFQWHFVIEYNVLPLFN